MKLRRLLLAPFSPFKTLIDLAKKRFWPSFNTVPVTPDHMLLEDGDALLLEDGDKLIL